MKNLERMLAIIAKVKMRKWSESNLKLNPNKANPHNEIEEWFRIEFPNKDEYNNELRASAKEAVKRISDDSDYISQTDDDAQNVTVNEDIKENEKGYEGAIAHIFDWDKYFYSHLPKSNEQKIENDKMFMQIIDNSKWHDRMKKRGVGFLLIITEWAKYVKAAVVRKNIFWQDVPGYKVIVKAVLREMQKRQLLMYPDALVDCAIALLSNEKILSVFVKIVFKKTNIYDSSNVICCIDLVVQWFSRLQKNHQYIPASFDFSFFLKGVKILLEQDHLILRSKCLWMIYKSLHLFPAEAKEELINLIVNKYFYTLFYSWSWNVRSLITHLLLYQLHFIHFELVNIINEKAKNDCSHSAKYQNTIMRNLIKPIQKQAIIIDSDNEAIYDENMTNEYKQIGVLHQTDVINILKEKMEEIDFLIEYFTGKKSKKQVKLTK